MSSNNTFTKRPVSAAVQAAIYAMALSASVNVQAAPTGGAVVGGTGSINQSGLNTTINQTSQNMAINWQTYNVNQNERVQYIQPNTSSISLNRILSNNGSTIAGRIDANGQVILVNPNGIFFTSTAVVNVGGIIASGLDITPDDFMNGNYIFNEVVGKDGKVVNTGTINASLGGNVALLGKQVENDGLIAASLGTVSLAAGKQAVLTFDNGGVLGVRISKAILQDELGVDPAVLNKGEIQAAGGRVLMSASTSQDVFSQAVNTGDIQQATSVVVNADGSFTLGSGADVVNSGTVDTSTTDAGQGPGQIVMLGNNVTSSGTLNADAAAGNAGEIELHATDTSLLTGDSVTSARSVSDGVGGLVKVLADKVGLFDQSTVDVSGANGGGQALIGGGSQGKNSLIQNASRTYVSTGTRIFADALENGNGGKIINWSNDSTWFYGSAFTRGGSVGGDGGLVEISGKGLAFSGSVDTTANNGMTGTVLFDPTNINIIDGNNGANDGLLPDLSGAPAGDFEISEVALEGLSSTTDIVLDATNDITLQNLFDNALSLRTRTGHSITIAADSDGNGAGNFTMLDTQDTIYTNGGDIIISGANITTGGLSTTSTGRVGGQIKITASGDVSVTNLDTRGGSVTAGNAGLRGGLVSITGNSISLDGINTSGSNSNDIFGFNTAGNSGSITLDTSAGTGDITVSGAIIANGGNGPTGGNNADGNGGDASLVKITSARDITLNSTGSISANGGNATSATGNADGSGGSSSGITLTAGRDLFVYAALSANGGEGSSTNTGGGASGNGGDAGAVTLNTSRNLELSAGITAKGGSAPNGTAGTDAQINMNGSSGNNVFTILDNPTFTGTSVYVNGNNGNDTLVHDGALAINDAWTIGQVSRNLDGQNDGSLIYNGNKVYFSDIANLTGGTQADTFNIQSDGFITGLIDGGSSGVTDQLNIVSNSASETVVELGARSTYDPTRISVNNVEQISAGGTSAFRVIGPDSASVWSVDGTTTVNFAPDIATPTSDQLVSLTGFDTIQGGTAQDTFNVTGGYAGILDGGSGTSNILNITSNAVTSVLVTLGNAIPTGSTANVFVNNFQTIDASTNGAANTLAVNGGASWNIDTQDHGTVAGITFTNFTNLIGGAGNNTFDIHAGITSISVNDTSTASTSDASSVHVYSGGSVTGAITGGAGTETFTVDAGGQVNTINTGTGSYADSVILANPGVVTAASSSATPALTGGSGNDSLTVLSTGNTWAFSAADATTGYVLNTTYSANPVYFTGFANPSGGGNDTLDYSAVTGNISLDLNKITGIGTIIGNYGVGTTTISGLDNATNTWTIEPVTVNAALTDGVNDGTVDYGANSLVFANVTDLIGGAGATSTNNFIITAGSAFAGNMTGGAGGMNFLNAQPGVSNTWTIDAPDGGNVLYTLPAGAYTTNFANVENLVSGGVDIFNLASNTTNNTTGSLSGYISGTSADTLNVGVDNTTVRMMSALTDVVAPGQLNVYGINSLNSTGAQTTLISPSTGSNQWSISGNSIGTINTSVSFSGFANLTAGGANDTFDVAGGWVTGIINGSGTGTLSLNAATTVNLQNDPAAQLSTGTSSVLNAYGMTSITDQSATSTLVGATTNTSTNNIWVIDGQNSGNVEVAGTTQKTVFSGFRNLGSGGNDTFTLTTNSTNSTTGALDGYITGEIADTLYVNIPYTKIQLMSAASSSLNSTALNILGVGNLDATGTATAGFPSTATLIGDNNTINYWTINQPNQGNVKLGSATNNIQFTGFSNLTSGTKTDVNGAGDTFNMQNNGFSSNGQLTGLINGQGVASLSISNTTNTDYTILIEAADPGQLNSPPYTVSVFNMQSTTGGNVVSDSPNIWYITGPNQVTLDNGVKQTSLTTNYITGGNYDDTFVWQDGGSLTKTINGGGGLNTLVIDSTNDRTVVIGGTSSDTNTMSVSNVQQFAVSSTSTGTNYTLEEANNPATTIWNLAPTSFNAYGLTTTFGLLANNSGTINDGSVNATINGGLISFVGFNNLKANQGGSGSNEFNLSTGGGLSGYIYGDGTNDLFTINSTNTGAYSVQLLSAAPATGTIINNPTNIISLFNVYTVVGNDTVATANNTLLGFNNVNFTDYWSLDGQNAGSISLQSNGSNAISFQNFGNLVGSASADEFNVSGGSYSGTVKANGGQDLVNVTLSGNENGQFNFQSNNNANTTISISGNSSTGPSYTAVYSPDHSFGNINYQQIQYTSGANTYSVNYTNASAINDSVSAGNFTVDASRTNLANIDLDNLQPGSGLQGSAPLSFRIGANPYVNLSNKQVLTVSGSNTDTISINAGLDLTGMGLSLTGRDIVQLQNTVITADALTLQDFGNLGNAISLNTDVANLGISNIQRNVSINQTGSALQNQTLAVSATGMSSPLFVDMTGDVNLTGTSGMSGQIKINANNITVNNDSNTNLGDIMAATNLTVVNTSGNITQSGVVQAGALADFAANSGDIILNNTANNFSDIQVDSGNTVDIADMNGIGLTSLTANNVTINALGAITDSNGGATNITANSVTLRAVDGIGGGAVNYTDADGYSNLDSSGAIHTQTASLDVINQNTVRSVGTVNINNQGTVTVKNLKNNGDIIFANSNGTVNLDGSAPGAINANLNGTQNDASFAGSVAITGDNSNSLFTDSKDGSVFDITAQNLLVRNYYQFGTRYYPIRLLVRNQATLIATTGSFTFPLGDPALPVVTIGDLVQIQGFNVLSGQQLIDIESLGDVDPAIFTKVRNYNHEDVAILMPADQRLDDECTSDDRKKCKKQKTLN